MSFVSSVYSLKQNGLIGLYQTINICQNILFFFAIILRSTRETRNFGIENDSGGARF